MQFCQGPKHDLVTLYRSLSEDLVEILKFSSRDPFIKILKILCIGAMKVLGTLVGSSCLKALCAPLCRSWMILGSLAGGIIWRYENCGHTMSLSGLDACKTQQQCLWFHFGRSEWTCPSLSRHRCRSQHLEMPQIQLLSSVAQKNNFSL